MSREAQLQQAIENALNCLGRGGCPVNDCEGCKVDAEMARHELAETGLRPHGFGRWSQDAQQQWLDAYAPTKTPKAEA